MEIKQKIKALLDKASAFMSKVEELLERHNIKIHELGDISDVVDLNMSAFSCWQSSSWVKDLACIVAAYYGCKPVIRKRGNKYTIALAGRESACVTFDLMMPFIMKQVLHQAQKIRAQRQLDLLAPLSLGRLKRSVGNALLFRIQDMLVETKKRDDARGYALVPVDELDAIVNEAFPNMREGKASTLRTNNAAIRAAGSISLNKQTDNRSALQLS